MSAVWAGFVLAAFACAILAQWLRAAYPLACLLWVARYAMIGLILINGRTT
jgi:hypothetical protein